MSFTKRTMLWTVGLILVPLTVVGLITYSVFADDGRQTATVIEVVDGDTVDVNLEEAPLGQEVRRRSAGAAPVQRVACVAGATLAMQVPVADRLHRRHSR